MAKESVLQTQNLKLWVKQQFLTSIRQQSLHLITEAAKRLTQSCQTSYTVHSPDTCTLKHSKPIMDSNTCAIGLFKMTNAPPLKDGDIGFFGRNAIFILNVQETGTAGLYRAHFLKASIRNGVGYRHNYNNKTDPTQVPVSAQARRTTFVPR